MRVDLIVVQAALKSQTIRHQEQELALIMQAQIPIKLVAEQVVKAQLAEATVQAEATRVQADMALAVRILAHTAIRLAAVHMAAQTPVELLTAAIAVRQDVLAYPLAAIGTPMQIQAEAQTGIQTGLMATEQMRTTTIQMQQLVMTLIRQLRGLMGQQRRQQ